MQNLAEYYKEDEDYEEMEKYYLLSIDIKT